MEWHLLGADLPISLTKEDANEDVGAPRESTHRFDNWDRRWPRRLEGETFRNTNPDISATFLELKGEDANEDVGAPRKSTQRKDKPRFFPWDRRRPRRLDWDPLPKQGPLTQPGLETRNESAQTRFRKLGNELYPFRDLPQPTLMADPGV